MKYRIISFFLAFLLNVEMLPVKPFTHEKELLTDDSIRYITFDADHGYRSCTAKDTNRIALRVTEYPDIYIAENGVLFSYAGDSKYQTVEKHVITLDSPDHVCLQLSEIDVDEETKQEIINVTHEQSKLGNNDALVAIFMPTLTATDKYADKQAPLTEEYGYQYIHNGITYYMHDKLLYYLNLTTGWYTIEEGVPAKYLRRTQPHSCLLR